MLARVSNLIKSALTHYYSFRSLANHKGNKRLRWLESPLIHNNYSLKPAKQVATFSFCRGFMNSDPHNNPQFEQFFYGRRDKIRQY